MATLAKLLQVEMGLPDMAKRLASAGRGKDTILAHINPKEMALLKKHGGSGKVNPSTGVMEFDDGVDYSNAPDETSAETNRLAANEQAVVQSQAPRVDTGVDEASFAPSGPTNRMGNATAYYPSGGALSIDTQYPTPADPGRAQVSRSLAPTAPQPTGSPYGNIDLGATDRSLGESGTAAAQPSFGQRVEQFGEDVSKTLQPYGRGASAISKALDPFVPYGKAAFDLYSQYQQRKASEAADAKAAENQARLEAMAQPYRERAAAVAQQGQALVQAGQAGQLTADQQQKLEAARAQAVQQATSSGMDSGTAQMQTEAQMARIAAQFAADNVNQGIALINNANTISGQADAIITGAINTGYQQSAAATQLAQNYAKNIGYNLPQTQSKGPV